MTEEKMTIATTNVAAFAEDLREEFEVMGGMIDSDEITLAVAVINFSDREAYWQAEQAVALKDGAEDIVSAVTQALENYRLPEEDVTVFARLSEVGSDGETIVVESSVRIDSKDDALINADDAKDKIADADESEDGGNI